MSADRERDIAIAVAKTRVLDKLDEVSAGMSGSWRWELLDQLEGDIEARKVTASAIKRSS